MKYWTALLCVVLVYQQTRINDLQQRMEDVEVDAINALNRANTLKTELDYIQWKAR